METKCRLVSLAEASARNNFRSDAIGAQPCRQAWWVQALDRTSRPGWAGAG